MVSDKNHFEIIEWKEISLAQVHESKNFTPLIMNNQ